MKISIYGCGLTGLVSACALSSVGNEVVLVSCAGEDISALQQGQLGFEEPGLSDKLIAELAAERLKLHDGAGFAYTHGEIHFIAFPSDQLPQAEQLVRKLAVATQGPIWVVNQSTFPVGTVERLKQLMLIEREQQGRAEEVHFLSLPSFLQEGSALQNFTRPNRILVGSDDEWGLKRLIEVLRPFNRNHDQLMLMSSRAAELTKYAINGMLATKLSFMNEMANLADQLQVDIEQVRQGVGSDPRIGYDYIYPGCGFGGLSFSEDIITLAQTIEANVEDSSLLQAVLNTNQQQKELLFRKLWCYWEANMAGKTVAVWGASFKPNTDRIDNAPSLTVMEALWSQGANVRLYDPQALPRIAGHYGQRADLVLCSSAYEALEGADALLILTEWKEFWSPDFGLIAAQLKDKVIFDGRNLYDPSYLKSLGFRYFGIGRSSEFIQE